MEAELANVARVALSYHHWLKGVIYNPTRCCRHTLYTDTSTAKFKFKTLIILLEAHEMERWRS